MFRKHSKRWLFKPFKLCKKSFHYCFQATMSQYFNKITKNSKSKLICADCKIGFDTGALTNKENVTIQSLTKSVQFMSIKFDKFNNTVSKSLNEMKEL